jgi:hypothetical protein
MSKPVAFPGSNYTLGAPPGAENVSPLPIFRNGTCCVSAWELTDAEIAEIVKSRRVFLSVFFGNSQPPVYVGSETSVREIVADYGAWKR